MPIYEYVCKSCEHAFEELVRSPTDRDATRCPRCESSTIERKLSVFAARMDTVNPPETAADNPCGRCEERGRSCPF